MDPASNNAQVYKPPVRPATKRPSVFLAGSIEQGKAKPWQEELSSALSHLPIHIFNPRREKWDKNLKQDISEPVFKEQVDWELDLLDQADLIALYLQPDTLSPVSLLELGLHAKDMDGKLVVCCPEGFWRRGNVQVVCDRDKIPLVETDDQFRNVVKERMEKLVKEADPERARR